MAVQVPPQHYLPSPYAVLHAIVRRHQRTQTDSPVSGADAHARVRDLLHRVRFDLLEVSEREIAVERHFREDLLSGGCQRSVHHQFAFHFLLLFGSFFIAKAIIENKLASLLTEIVLQGPEMQNTGMGVPCDGLVVQLLETELLLLQRVVHPFAFRLEQQSKLRDHGVPADESGCLLPRRLHYHQQVLPQFEHQPAHHVQKRETDILPIVLAVKRLLDRVQAHERLFPQQSVCHPPAQNPIPGVLGRGADRLHLQDAAQFQGQLPLCVGGHLRDILLLPEPVPAFEDRRPRFEFIV